MKRKINVDMNKHLCLKYNNEKKYAESLKLSLSAMPETFYSHAFTNEFRKHNPQFKDFVIHSKTYLKKYCKQLSRFHWQKGERISLFGETHYIENKKLPKKLGSLAELKRKMATEEITLEQAIKRIKMESDYVIYKITKQEI